MSLSIGIVGLPNVGKSTLFNALTKSRVLAANYPFATIDPNVGMVNVPDPRLAKLAALYNPAKIVPAAVTFVDIAGLVRGAAEGQGLGNQFLATIRQTDAVVQVVRAFSDTNVTHVAGKVDPAEDIATIQTELILADLQAIDRQLPKLQADAKRGGDAKVLLQHLEHARHLLDSGQTLFAQAQSASSPHALEGLEAIQHLQLLTAKPFIFVFNVDEADMNNDALKQQLAQLVSPAPAIILCAKLEAELAELPDDEAAELLSAVGQTASGLSQLITLGYRTLGLQTFLTAGPQEVRAWTIRQGATAPEAAGVIHTDFQKGFIKAEIVAFDDLVAAGSLAAAKAAGKVRLEGKDYVMREGDVVEFRFNV